MNDLELMRELGRQSNEDLYLLLSKSSKENLRILQEYNFGTNNKELKSPKEIGDRIRYNGSNNIANIIRFGESVDYHEVVRDVASKIGVKYQDTDDVENIEQEIFIKIINDAIKNMSFEDLQKFENELHKNGIVKNGDSFSPDFLQRIIKAGVLGPATLYLFRFVALQVAARLGLVALGGVVLVPLAIPILILIDSCGPNYKCTIPSVIQIAYMRQLEKYKEFEK